jgi:ADP-heptose:LPS heptosyltransferase
LGDLLVALPAIQLLRKRYPSSLISLVCREEYGKLLERTGVVDECISQENRRVTSVLSGSLGSGGEGDLRLQDFDRVTGWFKKKDSASGLEEVLSSTGVSSGLFVYDGPTQETISRNFFRKTLEWIEGESSEELSFEECARLPLSSTQKEEGRQILGEGQSVQGDKLIVVHPGSGSREKCWPLTCFLEVVRRLDRRNVQGLLVTGPAEEWLKPGVDLSDFPDNWFWVHSPSLLRLAGLLATSPFYLGNDSGITHLAAACGAAGWALFRKDLEAAWKPYGDISVITGTAVQDILLEEVWNKIEERISSG